jgi:flagellum-specific ATP synthase
VVLTRTLAHVGHYPAVDVLQSVSRLIGEIVPDSVREAGQKLRAALASYREKEDLISIGAYQRGTDPMLDAAIALKGEIDAFLRQRVDEPSTVEGADGALLALTEALSRVVDASGGEVVGGAPGAPGPPAAAPAPRAVAVPAPGGAQAAIPALQLAI